MLAIACTFLFLLGIAAEETGGHLSGSEPDWIPAGPATPSVERKATEARALIQTGDPRLQRSALDEIQRDAANGVTLELREAAVPVIGELLNMDYRILEFPTDYRVDLYTRFLALETLSALGGEAARSQIRNSLSRDDDGAVRARAAQLLAQASGTDPETDFVAVAAALHQAVKRQDPEYEISPLVDAAYTLSGMVWNPNDPAFLEALISIYQKGYSAGLRRRAMSILEELSER